MSLEATARETIDRLLQAASWHVCDVVQTNFHAASGFVKHEVSVGRTEVPKPLIFAKDDSHAENIVEILCEEFGKGNDFPQKITCCTTVARPRELISAFRNSYHPRIAVTVDMIATGTDIKQEEIVFFMCAVKSRSFFEQMKGYGVRVIKTNNTDSTLVGAEIQYAQYRKSLPRARRNLLETP